MRNIYLDMFTRLFCTYTNYMCLSSQGHVYKYVFYAIYLLNIYFINFSSN